MTEHVRFEDRCRHCGEATDLTSAIQHTCEGEDGDDYF